jgi:hypothetical protein
LASSDVRERELVLKTSDAGLDAPVVIFRVTTGASSPASLVLSTSSLSRTSEEAKDDVSEQLNPEANFEMKHALFNYG